MAASSLIGMQTSRKGESVLFVFIALNLGKDDILHLANSCSGRLGCHGQKWQNLSSTSQAKYVGF